MISVTLNIISFEIITLYFNDILRLDSSSSCTSLLWNSNGFYKIINKVHTFILIFSALMYHIYTWRILYHKYSCILLTDISNYSIMFTSKIILEFLVAMVGRGRQLSRSLASWRGHVSNKIRALGDQSSNITTLSASDLHYWYERSRNLTIRQYNVSSLSMKYCPSCYVPFITSLYKII